MSDDSSARSSYRSLGIFQRLDGIVGLFHVKRLLRQLISLSFIPAHTRVYLIINKNLSEIQQALSQINDQNNKMA